MTDETPPAGTRTLDTLVGALQGLGRQTAELAADVRADAEQRRVEDQRRQKLIVGILGIGVVLVLLVGAVLFVGQQNRQLGESNRQLGEQNRRLADNIADCTTEGGRCQQEGARRTAAAVDELAVRFTGRSLELLVYLRRCELTAGVDTDAELIRCVQARLAAAPAS